MKLPLISVIMPVYNAEKYVGQAIESILNQTFTDFEFLIFNDGSSDKSADIVAHYASQDSRIVFYNYQANTGYLKHLNEGIEKAQGKYIARMDADDISLPHRFERQLEFMEANEEAGVCGSWFEVFEKDIEHTSRIIKHSVLDFDIKIDLLYYCSLGHPTIMAKTCLLKNNHYDQNFYPAEDYELWTRLAPITKFHNIAEVLLLYRWHENNISKTKQDIQLEKMNRVRQIQFNRLGLADNKDIHQLSYFFTLPSGKSERVWTIKEIKNIAKNIEIVYKANTDIYDKDKWYSFLNEKWVNIVKNTPTSYDISLLFLFISFPFPTFSLLSFKEKLSFSIKCLIHWKTRTN